MNYKIKRNIINGAMRTITVQNNFKIIKLNQPKISNQLSSFQNQPPISSPTENSL